MVAFHLGLMAASNPAAAFTMATSSNYKRLSHGTCSISLRSGPDQEDIDEPYPTLDWSIENLPMVWNHGDQETDALGLLKRDLENSFKKIQMEEPVDITKTGSSPDTNPSLDPFRLFLKGYGEDRGHEGHFGVDSEHTLPANVVFSQEDPLGFLQEGLCGQERILGNDMAVVFCSSIHSNLRDATRQKRYLSNLFDGMPLCLLHVGCQDKAVAIELTAEIANAVSNDLQLSNLPCEDSQSRVGSYILTGQGFDILRATVAWDSSTTCEDPLIESLVKLIDVTVAEWRTSSGAKKKELAIVAYSMTTRAVSTALSIWKEQATLSSTTLRNQGLIPEEAEKLLREAVTIVTLSGLCNSFPDGPAYIHVSMINDVLSVKFGATRQKSAGGGKDAVFLHSFAPYDNTRNKHNPEASALQFLAMTMRVNGMQNFRQLYTIGSRPTPVLDIAPKLFAINYSNTVGELDLPVDDLVLSMIRASGGYRRLESGGVDEDDDILPDLFMAEATLTEHFGYDVYEEIYQSCFNDDISVDTNESNGKRG